MFLNPPGRDMDGRSRTKGKFRFLNFKENYIVSVMNLQTIRNSSKHEELSESFSRNRIDVLGIVGHKIIHEDPDEYHEKENITFIRTSVVGNVNDVAIGRLGLSENKSSSDSFAEIIHTTIVY